MKHRIIYEILYPEKDSLFVVNERRSDESITETYRFQTLGDAIYNSLLLQKRITTCLTKVVSEDYPTWFRFMTHNGIVEFPSSDVISLQKVQVDYSGYSPTPTPCSAPELYKDPSWDPEPQKEVDMDKERVRLELVKAALSGLSTNGHLLTVYSPTDVADIALKMADHIVRKMENNQ